MPSVALKPTQLVSERVIFLAFSEEIGRAEFNLATPTYATVVYSVRQFINKTLLKLLQEGFKVEPQQIYGIYFHMRYLGIFEFSNLYL